MLINDKNIVNFLGNLYNNLDKPFISLSVLHLLPNQRA
jgi:hypothetical protein